MKNTTQIYARMDQSRVPGLIFYK